MEVDQQHPLVLPGDTIDPSLIPTHKKQPLRLGPGLRHIPPNAIIPTVAGQLIADHKKNSMWVEYNGGRYIPSPNDLVIGQIVRSAADLYYVNLTPYTSSATLPQLAFEGATKKTRPILAPGALIYARVTLANRHMDAELECVSGSTGKAEGLGPLTGGMAFDVSLGLARRLLMARSREEGGVEVLELLGGEGLAFETAVGRNGRVWVGSESTKTVIAVGRALRETDEGDLGVEQQRKLVKRLIREMR
ncbi:hypothetical protein B0T17DRAFT_573577 [Bombardia bombarda]|uniref:Ribosomal RNA-processing protein 40 n=1 Tax=Bombardia bombarda TaxID=252184 RepID=A0AA39X7Y3_9PEZI|nr:hypothetical protein B0T17DRAFT_573577 [Bombardia bombarda]